MARNYGAPFTDKGDHKHPHETKQSGHGGNEEQNQEHNSSEEMRTLNAAKDKHFDGKLLNDVDAVSPEQKAELERRKAYGAAKTRYTKSLGEVTGLEVVEAAAEAKKNQ